jgi:hypothetical protein
LANHKRPSFLICSLQPFIYLEARGQGPTYWKITPPPWAGISADVIWGKKYEKAKRKRGKCKRKRKTGERKMKKGERK